MTFPSRQESETSTTAMRMIADIFTRIGAPTRFYPGEDYKQLERE